MQEKIYLAPGADGNELKKSLAMHGVSTLGMRIMGAAELADLALVRAGVTETKHFISAAEETAMIAQAVEGENYFGRTTYSDIQKIASAVRLMRSLVTDDDEAAGLAAIMGKGLFADKNTALMNVYHKYMKAMADADASDSIQLIREAINKGSIGKAELITLREYPLSPLERKLADSLIKGSAREESVTDLFGKAAAGGSGVTAIGGSVKINSYKNNYGAPNEVETIINTIYKNHQADKCLVAVTDTATYGQLFFDYALLYDIPVTFGCGIPVINSNPARLLQMYYSWMSTEFFSGTALRAMTGSEAFDSKKFYAELPEVTEGMDFEWKKLHELCETIRLTNDPDINKLRLDNLINTLEESEQIYIPFLKIISRELALPTEEFIKKYSYIRKGSTTNADRTLMNLDICAVRAICDALAAINISGIEQTAEDIIMNILSMNVCRQSSEPGALHVTTIGSAFTCMRDNIFIAGMSASKFPGAPTENYLLLDADLKLFGPDADYMTSEGSVRRKKESLMNLVELASALGCSVSVSYAGLNVSELKKDNASSLIYELFRREHGQNATSKDLDAAVENVDYFSPAIQKSRLVGNAYNAGKNIIPEKTIAKDICITTKKGDLDRSYSPSALNKFFNCPRSFMIGHILGIPEPDDKDNFEVIDAASSGTLAHSMMERLANTNMTAAEFLKLCGEEFDKYIIRHTPVIAGKVDAVKEEFLRMMETAYARDPHREVVLKEEDIRCNHESGVKIHGFPDRVEKLDDGTYMIVDFKTGRNVSHVQDDIDTCLQIVIYAYLMEQKGYKVSSGEFRYIRQDEVVSCVYDDDMKERLKAKLEEFKEHMENGDFPLSEFRGDETNDPCHFCKYGSICGKEKI